MKAKFNHRLLAVIIALLMVVQLVPTALLVSATEENVHVLDATADLTAMAAGDKADGDTEVIADYFTITYSAKTKIDGSEKTFDDGYTATQRLNFGGKTNTSGMLNTVKFTTAAAATVKIWWVSGGDGRSFAIYDEAGQILMNTTDESIKNSLYISELKLETAGTYYLGVPEGSNYLFKLEVTEEAAQDEGGNEEPVAPATLWDFRSTEFEGQAEWNGLKIVSANSFKRHGDTYGLAIKDATITVPVSGPSQIIVSVGYNWDVTFPDGTQYRDDTNSGDIDVVYEYTGEAGTVDIVVGADFTCYIKQIEVKEIVPPATLWNFRSEEFAGQGEWNGLKIVSANSFKRHGDTYGLAIKDATITVPVSGPSQIIVSVGYNWDVTFPDGTQYRDDTNSGDIDVVYEYTGEAGTVDIVVGADFTCYIKQIEVKEIVEPATYWDFRLDEYNGEKEYNGLVIEASQCNKHGATYGLQIANGTIYVPVPGPAQISVAVGYNWDVTFPDGTQYSDKTDSGDITLVFNYTGEAGMMPIAIGNEFTSYIKFIQVDPKDVSEVPELDPSKIYVWDFGAAVLEGEQYVNMLTVDEINSWFADVEPGSTGINIASFVSSDGLLRFEDGGYPTTHRLRTKNAALSRWDDKSLTDADGNEYTGYIYSNKSQDASVYLAIKVNAGEKVTIVVGSNGGDSLINFEAPSGNVVTAEYLSSGAKAQALTFYPTESGEYRIYSTTEKLVVARIIREATSDITVTGKVEAPEGLKDYSVVFTNTLSGAVYTAEVKDGAYTVTLKDGYSYTMTLANANGYVITSADTLTIEKGAAEVTNDIIVEQVDLVTVTGTLAGLNEETLAKLTIEFKADTLYIPEITVSGNTYIAILEKGVTYELVAYGINDYAIVSEQAVCYNEDAAADIVFQAKPTYTVTIAPEGATLADLAEATFTFTNLNEEGYVYTFVGAENIALRDGVYAVKVTNAGAFVQLLTSNVKVNGADLTKTIRFTDDITEWLFSDEDFTGTGGSFNGLLFSNGQKNKTYLLANTGTISVPVDGPCKIVVSACYKYSFYFASEDEASVAQETGSTSQIDSFVYLYNGEAGFVEITVLGQSYLTKIEIVQIVEFKDTITVGAEGCDYTTINAALDAIKAMDRPNNERVTILIQPGNYEEMLVVDVPNVTLKNASENPSIGLTNCGVDIEENAVRITWYYGHGYTYYSMSNDCKYDADVLQVNRENGYPSFENPGAGTTNGSYWNATVVINADGFRAEGIIFENSFNQYISAAAALDVLIAQGSVKEGSIPRSELPFGSTAVQDKTYVERAAALAIGNNCKEIYFENCKFIGRQDTLYGGTNTTAAFYDCAIYGGTDYIFGGMTAVFAKCDLVFNTSEHKNDVGYITAAQQKTGRGFLMYNCTITSTIPGVDTASQYPSKPGYYGRPWAANTSEVVFYMTNIEATCTNWYSLSASLIRPDGWLSTLSGESNLVGEFGTYEIAMGVDNSASRVGWANVFETETLADGTPITVEAFLGEWDAFAGKDMTIVMSTEKVDNAPKEDVGGDDDEPIVTITTEHDFNSLNDVNIGSTNDKAEIPEGTTFADGFFVTVGKLTQRYQESKGGVYAVEIAKNGQGAMEFTVKGTAQVTIVVSSTGGSNTSAVALINVATGEIMTNVEGLTEVSTTAATTLTYKDLPAGTYQLISPESDYNRGFRLMTIHVEQTITGPAPTGDIVSQIVAALLMSAVGIVALVPAKKRFF